MEQQNLASGPRTLERMHTAPPEPDQLQVMFREQSAIVFQPGAARCRKRSHKILMRDAALEIVIARSAVDRRLDLTDERERFRREARLFHKVAGEADEIRRE